MRVLVAVASRHGSTRQIGEAVGEVLRAAEHDAEVVEPDEVDDLDGFDAVILGSAVYVGRWSGSARAFVDRFVGQLDTRPVWLFSSGPVGDPPAPIGEPEEVPRLVRQTAALGHRVFPGRLEPAGLALAERAVVALLRAEHGDFRPWADVRDWAAQIAADLHTEESQRLHHTT
jgi:menaquinone-dependent protoporphyrinogen oxidase